MTGENGDSLINWILATAASIVATLVGTVVSLTKYIEGKYRKEVEALIERYEKLESRFSQCEAEREALRIEIARIEARQELIEMKIKKS